MSNLASGAGETAQPASKWLLITAVILLLLGLAMLAFGIFFVSDANASNDWPAVTGTVQNVRVTWSTSSTDPSNANRDYIYEINYDYLVDDVAYDGDRYSLGNGSNAAPRNYDSEEEARSAAYEVYTPGRDVTVYYNPADPSQAVLAPGANTGTYIPALFGALLLLGGAAVLWLYLRLRAKDSY